MAENSKIEWTGATWNFLIGCDKVSAGCKGCYAILQAWIRMHNPNEKIQKKFAGTVKKENGKLNWTGQINFDERTLLMPLEKKEPTTYFVNSMSDLFHENVQNEWIDKAFAVMALCPQHTFQILTKRPERMRDYFITDTYDEESQDYDSTNYRIYEQMIELKTPHLDVDERRAIIKCERPPFDNVWLGVSVENQQTADERIPLLLETPAAVRFLSCEPLLEEVDLREYLGFTHKCQACDYYDFEETFIPENDEGDLECPKCQDDTLVSPTYHGFQFIGEPEKIDWVIVGGESGHGARGCDIDWIRSIVRQCKATDVPVFVKQLGAKPFTSKGNGTPETPYCREYLKLKSKKGGDIAEFSEDLRIREMSKEK